MGCVVCQQVAVAMGSLPPIEHSYIYPTTNGIDTSLGPSPVAQLNLTAVDNKGGETAGSSGVVSGLGVALVAFGGHVLTP